MVPKEEIDTAAEASEDEDMDDADAMKEQDDDMLKYGAIEEDYSSEED